MRRLRDFAAVEDQATITAHMADKGLRLLEVDAAGLDSADHRYLRFIAENYQGGPVGVETIAAGLSEQRDTIEDTIEPFLLQIGFLQRSPRGRMLTPKAFHHIGLSAPQRLPEFNFEEQPS